MELPADLQSASVDTGNGGGGNITTTIVAGPGAGVRLRLWAVTVGDRNNQVPNTYTGNLRFRSIGAAVAGPMMSIQNGICAPVLLPGGLYLPENVGLEVLHSYSAVNVLVTIVAFYTIEAV